MGIRMDHWRYYGTRTLQVCPYMPGTAVYRDGVLPDLYGKLKAEGTLLDTFCGDQMNLDSFVSFFDRLKTMQVLCRVTEADKLVPVGFSWVMNAKGVDGARSLECGEAFFDGAAKTPDARKLARLALAYAFHCLRTDVLFGRQVASNIAARNFSARLGFREVALIPHMHFVNGELVDGRVMMLKKADFMEPFMKWKAAQE